MTEREKTIDRIRKLLAKAEGTNSPEEAAAFAEKAREMMLANDVSEAEARRSGERAATDEHREPLIEEEFDEKYDLPWRRALANQVALYYLCGFYRKKLYRGKKVVSVKYTFIGRPHRAAVARDMYRYFTREILRVSNLDSKKPHAWRNEFRKGCGIALAYLVMDKRTRERTSADSLLPMIIDEAEAEVQAAMSNMAESKSRELIVSNEGAFLDGARAAKGINLGDQLSGSQESRGARVGRSEVKLIGGPRG